MIERELPQPQSAEELLVEYIRERTRPDYEPVKLGFGSIDAITRGISLGQVCGIAARTAVGKTWLLETISHNYAIRKDAGALCLSLEMPGIEWIERAVGIYNDVSPEQVERWAKEGELGAKAHKFVERMEHTYYIAQAVHLEELSRIAQATRFRLKVPLRLVIVDYLGLLGAEGRDTYERISKLGIGLKAFAKKEEVAVVVAMQLSRLGGTGGEPVEMPMLRDSGVLEEALDFLIGCWRPEKAKGADKDEVEYEAMKDVMRIQLIKNRKGRESKPIDLRFRPESRRLYEEASPFVAAGEEWPRTHNPDDPWIQGGEA